MDSPRLPVPGPRRASKCIAHQLPLPRGSQTYQPPPMTSRWRPSRNQSIPALILQTQLLDQDLPEDPSRHPLLHMYYPLFLDPHILCTCSHSIPQYSPWLSLILSSSVSDCLSIKPVKAVPILCSHEGSLGGNNLHARWPIRTPKRSSCPGGHIQILLTQPSVTPEHECHRITLLVSLTRAEFKKAITHRGSRVARFIR